MEFIDLEKPKIKEKTNLQLLSGKDMPDIKIFSLVSEDDFELMTEQWLFSMKDRYKYVKRIGGSGDQGRDIFAYQDENMTILDIYQCKHYDKKLTPSNIYVEIGKLLYYTYNREYVVPKNYYIISSKGCGTALTKLIENPEKIKSTIIQNWNSNCKGSITKAKNIELNNAFKAFIKNFDFSIIHEITPLNFLEEFEKTKYYSSWFGLRKFKRKTPPEPSNIIEKNELTYVDKLYRAYKGMERGNQVENELINQKQNLPEEKITYKDIKNNIAKFKIQEKKIIEKFLGMESGCVLNFTNSKFSDFFLENFNINIYDEKYSDKGDSKAKRLRTF